MVGPILALDYWPYHFLQPGDRLMNSGSRIDQVKPVYEGVRERIQELIRKGELRVGDKLPPERKLAETFKVSRNSVREAIRALAEKNIVRSRHGDGTYISAPEESLFTDSLAQLLRTQSRRIKEVFEFRKLLEPQIASLAAEHISPKEVDRLKILVFEQERRLLAGEDDADLDAAFHLLLARATRNKVLLEVVKTLSHILTETRSGPLQSEQRRRASVRTHILIVDALERGDVQGAREAMRRHLSEVERLVFAGGRDQMDPEGPGRAGQS
jgi:GntR family transcriptional repressor for pyruvate dehydrogenase complex